MGDKTGIEWTDATWNPVAGCSLISPGCTNCYAMKQAARLLDKPGSHYEGTTRSVNGQAVWTGKIGLAPDRILGAPLHWKRPRRIFVNSMSDLFHDGVPDDHIDKVFAIMAVAHWHQFQILTKRPERMLAYFRDNGYEAADRWVRLSHEIARGPDCDLKDAFCCIGWSWAGDGMQWPLPNVWLGVSVEDQKRADERIPLLLQTPASVRFLSCEPLLGPVDLSGIDIDGDSEIRPLKAYSAQESTQDWGYPDEGHPAIDWVIAGGESGPGARPMHPDWVRSLRDQCAASDVPFFFKQWGEFAPLLTSVWPPHPQYDQYPQFMPGKFNGEQRDIYYWGNDFYSVKTGKRAAGRTLDGRTHDGYPDNKKTGGRHAGNEGEGSAAG